MSSRGSWKLMAAATAVGSVLVGLQSLPDRATTPRPPLAEAKAPPPAKKAAERSAPAAGPASGTSRAATLPAAETRPEGYDDNPLQVGPAVALEPPKTPVGFAEAAESLEQAAGDSAELGNRLEDAFGRFSWADSAQVASMAAFLQGFVARHADTRETVGAYLEREVFRRALVPPNDPRTGRQLVEAYLAVVSDASEQRRVLLRLRRHADDSATKDYCDDLFASVAGRAPRQEELDEGALPPPVTESPGAG